MAHKLHIANSKQEVNDKKIPEKLQCAMKFSLGSYSIRDGENDTKWREFLNSI